MVQLTQSYYCNSAINKTLSLAMTAPTSLHWGTCSMALPGLPLPASSLLIPMNANSREIFWTMLIMFCNALELAMMSRLITNDLFLLDSANFFLSLTHVQA